MNAFQTAGPEKKPVMLPALIVDRMAEAAEAAELNDGVESLLEAITEGVVLSFTDGDFDLIMTGWEFDNKDRPEIAARLAGLAQRWRAEDEKEVKS